MIISARTRHRKEPPALGGVGTILSILLLSGFMPAVAAASSAGSAPTVQTVAVFAGYYDTHHKHNLQPKPKPWKGSSNVVFVGRSDGASGGWDTSAVRVDNLGILSLKNVAVSVDIGTHHYALWRSQTIPAGATLIVAQMGLETFDGSDTNRAGCVKCDPKMCATAVSTTVPVVHVTIGGQRKDYSDTGQVLNTHGVDRAGCPYTGTRNDESQTWQQIGMG